jgi:hypothetical protein
MLSDLPFAPGESPFRTKGNVYKSLFDSADTRVPGGRKAVLEQIDDPALAKFFSQNFLAASTYDVLPIVPFGMVGAKILNVPYLEFVRGGAAFTARRDMNGIYKVLLKLASPEAVVKRLPRILIQYFNFGKVEGNATSSCSYQARATGIPQPILLWVTNAARGFIPVVMAAAGARDTEVVIDAPEPDRKEHGVMLFRTSFEVRWRKQS